MRRLLFVLMVLCGAAWAQVVQPLIQAQGTAGSQTCVYAQNVVSGHVLIVGASSEGTLTGISDTRTSSWTLIDSSTANSVTSRVWVASAASGGADTVTVTGVNSFNNIACAEFDSSVTTTTVDVSTNGGYTGTPSTVTTTGITPTINGDVLFAYISGFQSGGQLWPTSPLQYLTSTNNNDSSGSGYEVLGVSGSSTSVTFGNATNTKGNYVVIALKPTASIAITTAALPSASLTNSYSYQLQAVQGAGAYTWSVSSGALPTGLSLNASTGVISGTPTGGTATPTFQVTDGTHTITSALTLTVNSTAGTISFVQGVIGTIANAALTSVAVGDVILAETELAIPNAASIVPPTDSLATHFVNLGSIFMPAVNGNVSLLWAGVATSSGSDTISTPNGAVFQAGAQAHNAQGIFDATGFTTGQSASSATFTSNGLTTPAPNSLLYAIGGAFTTSSTLVAVSPYTSDGSTSGGSFPQLAEYNIFSSAGSQAASFTQGSNTNGRWFVTAIALRPGTSGVVNTNHRRAWVISK